MITNIIILAVLVLGFFGIKFHYDNCPYPRTGCWQPECEDCKEKKEGFYDEKWLADTSPELVEVMKKIKEER